MTEDDFEGSLVLEKLAQVGLVDEFFEAIDKDDFDQLRRLLRRAQVDTATINEVLRQIEEG